MVIINEAYIGRTKNLVEMERLIEKIRKQNASILGTSIFSSLPSVIEHVENSKEWRRMEQILEDEFGFYSLNLKIHMDPLPNAFTLPVNMAIDDNIFGSMILSNGNLVKYKKEYKVCTFIYITSGLLFSKKITPAELVGFILHEVGHNFNTSLLPLFAPVHILGILQNIYQNMVEETKMGGMGIGALFTAIMVYTSTGRAFNSAVIKWIDNCEGLRILTSIIRFFLSLPGIVNSLFTKVLHIGRMDKVLYGVSLVGATSVFPQIILAKAVVATMIAYPQEHFADSFAALYGYGPELSSGLAKLDKIKDESIEANKIINSIPLIGHMTGLVDFLFDHIVSMIDGHPNMNSRIKTTIALLEKDLEDTRVDSKTKTEVKKEIVRAKEVYATFNQLKVQSKDEDMSDYNAQMRAALERILESIYGRVPDLRAAIMDWTYGGASSIHNAIENNKRKTSWF